MVQTWHEKKVICGHQEKCGELPESLGLELPIAI